MSIHTDPKTGRLFIQFQHKGVSHKKRLPAGTLIAEAERLEVKLKHDLFFENTTRKTVAETDELWEVFVDTVYLEHVEANQSPGSLFVAINICKASMPHFKGMTLREIKVADVEKFKNERVRKLTRYGKRRMASTIHREMNAISAVFSLALKNELCDYNPVSRLDLPKFDNVQDKVLPLEEWERFFRGFRNRLQREICTVVLFTGLRQNDVLGLKKEHVDWNTGEIVKLQGKTKRKVRIAMNDTVAAILRKRMKLEGDLLFPSYRTGKQMHSIKHSIKFACERAGLPTMTIRDLRRSFGTLLHELGYDDSTVAQLLGHSDMRSIHRYKRGTAIKKEAVTSLDTLVKSAKNRATPILTKLSDNANSLETLVEMRRVELLTSSLRTKYTAPIIH